MPDVFSGVGKEATNTNGSLTYYLLPKKPYYLRGVCLKQETPISPTHHHTTIIIILSSYT